MKGYLCDLEEEMRAKILVKHFMYRLLIYFNYHIKDSNIKIKRQDNSLAWT